MIKWQVFAISIDGQKLFINDSFTNQLDAHRFKKQVMNELWLDGSKIYIEQVVEGEVG